MRHQYLWQRSDAIMTILIGLIWVYLVRFGMVFLSWTRAAAGYCRQLVVWLGPIRHNPVCDRGNRPRGARLPRAPTVPSAGGGRFRFVNVFHISGWLHRPELPPWLTDSVSAPSASSRTLLPGLAV